MDDAPVAAIIPAVDMGSRGARRAVVRGAGGAVRPKLVARAPAGRGSQAARQLNVLAALARSRRGLTAEELRSQLELAVSSRTVFRDLAQLQALHWVQQGDNGRWRVVAHGRGPASFDVTFQDVVALAVAVGAAGELVPQLSEALAKLRTRLRARLTPEGRQWSDDLLGQVGFSARARYRPADAAVKDIVFQGVQQDQLVRLRYRTPGKAPRERVVEPLAIVQDPGGLRLMAHCRDAGAVRSFLLARVEAAELLDETFERAPGGDVPALIRQSFGGWHGPQHHFVLELEPEVAHLAEELLIHPTQQVERLPDGRARVTFTASGLPVVKAWVAGFGGAVRAVEPPELVQAVRELHTRALAAGTGEPLTPDVRALDHGRGQDGDRS